MEPALPDYTTLTCAKHIFPFKRPGTAVPGYPWARSPPPAATQPAIVPPIASLSSDLLSRLLCVRGAMSGPMQSPPVLTWRSACGQTKNSSSVVVTCALWLERCWRRRSEESQERERCQRRERCRGRQRLAML